MRAVELRNVWGGGVYTVWTLGGGGGMTPGLCCCLQRSAPIGLSPHTLVLSLTPDPSPSAGGGAHRPLPPSCPPPLPPWPILTA